MYADRIKKMSKTFTNFRRSFTIQSNHLCYFASDLKKKAATIEVPSQELLNTAKLSSSVIPTLDLTEMRSKNY